MSLEFDKECQIVEKRVEEFFPYRRLNELARETGFCQRLRKIHPVIFLQVLIISSSLHKHPTVAEIWRRYTDLTDSDISYSSFVARFEDVSLKLIQRVLDECIQSPVTGLSLELRERYRKFTTLFIQDSSIIRLHEKLADRFPATRAKKIAAGIKVSYLLNVLANSPHTVSLVPERTAEIKTLRIGPWVKDSLLLIDLGFYCYQSFSKIDLNGGYFVSRVKKDSCLIITQFHSSVTAAQREMFTGKDLKHVLKVFRESSIDATVTIRVRTPSDKSGKRRSVPKQFRCVGRVHPETGKWHLYLTNLSWEEFSVDEIATLYGFRWEIESLFDESKNECMLGDVRVTRDGAILTLVCAALLRQLLLKRIYLVMRSLMTETQRARLSPDLFGRAFVEQMEFLLELVLGYWNDNWSDRDLLKAWQRYCNRLRRNARQYHPARLTRDSLLYR
jgi:IS4 transposase